MSYRKLRAFLEFDEDRTIRNAFLIEDPDKLSGDLQHILESGEFDERTLTVDRPPEMPDPESLKAFLARSLETSGATRQWMLVNLRVETERLGNDPPDTLKVTEVLRALSEKFRRESGPQPDQYEVLDRLEGTLEREVTRLLGQLDNSLTGEQVASELRYGFGWALGRWMAEWYLARFDQEGGSYDDEMRQAGLDLELQVPELQVGLGAKLLKLVEPAEDPPLLREFQSVRLTLARQLGVVVPPLTLRDSEVLRPAEYSLEIRELELLRGAVEGDYLAIGASGVLEELGARGLRPWGDLGAGWIPKRLAARAEQHHCILLNPLEAVTHHLLEVLRREAWRLLSIHAVTALVDRLSRDDPALVMEFERVDVPLATVRSVLRGLLQEGVSLRDLASILEAVLERADKSMDLESLLEGVRTSLGRSLYRHLVGADGVLSGYELPTELTESLIDADRHDQARLAERIVERMDAGQLPLVAVVDEPYRRLVWEALGPLCPEIVVLKWSEIEPDLGLELERLEL